MEIFNKHLNSILGYQTGLRRETLRQKYIWVFPFQLISATGRWKSNVKLPDANPREGLWFCSSDVLSLLIVV